MRVLTIVILMAISLGATLMLQAKMTGLWWLEWLILMGAGLFILAMFFGLWVEAEWAYPFSTVVFALALANLLWLYTRTQDFTVFAFGLLATIGGVVLSLSGIGSREEPEAIQTYDVPEKEAKAEPKKTAKKKTNKKRGRPKKKK